MNELLKIIHDKDFLMILGCVSGIVAFLMIVINIIKRKKNNMDPNISKQTIGNPIKFNNDYSENQSYNPFAKNNNEDVKEQKNKKVKEKKQKEVPTKKLSNIEQEKQKCIELYNTLYAAYESVGISTNLDENNILSYYNNWFINCSELEDYKIYQDNIQFQTQNIINEMNNAQVNAREQEEKRYYYEQCSIKLIELEQLFLIAKVDNRVTINNFNNRLLNGGIFITSEDYKQLYEEIMYNINYVNNKYKDVLQKSNVKEGKIDYKLMECLKILNCKENETNLNIIKKNYIDLIKEYHPDKNKDSESSLDMTSRINEAYYYIKETLTKC